MLVNYIAEPSVVEKILPKPFKPKLFDGKAIVGICLIRLKNIKPKGFPSFIGVNSENGAHRIAVEWEDQEFCTKIRYLIVEKAIAFISENQINSIEELPDNIFYTHYYETLSEIEKEKVADALKRCLDLSKQFSDEFFQIYNLDSDEKKLNFDISGFAVVASYHSDNKYYRYLLNEDLGTVVSGSLWLNNLSKNIPHLQSLTYQEYICKKQCEFLNLEIANIFSVYSKID